MKTFRAESNLKPTNPSAGQTNPARFAASDRTVRIDDFLPEILATSDWKLHKVLSENDLTTIWMDWKNIIQILDKS
jgi:hypothetical protein